MEVTIKELKKQLDKANKQLIRQHYIDQLTGLPNLYKLRRDMETEENFTFIVYNIDNFKLLNDFYGFIVGDVILESVAKRLLLYFNRADVYRIASDEFGILLPQKLSFYEIKTMMTNIAADLSHLTFDYADTKIHIDATLASANCPNAENIFSKVSMALKYAKQEYLKYWIFEEDMPLLHGYSSNLKFASQIRNALKKFGITPYFQPILDLKTEKVSKYEALSRLEDERGIIHSPTVFIPITKTIKIYDQVTKAMILKTFDMFSDNDLSFSINLSFEDIINPDIYQFILEMLIRAKVGDRVTFELLESENVTDFEKVLDFFHEIRRYGALVAIDDFGSGFSNFSYLIQLQPDFIKIDGSLIKDIDTDRNAQIVVETIVEFSKKLGIKTVAEYVHSSTILSTVKAMGIDYAQGYHIDHPKPNIDYP